MLKQTTYKHDLQDWTNALANDIWQHVIASGLELNNEAEPEIPQVYEITNLINGYARNPGHYDPVENLIVLNMMHERLDMDKKATIAHELAHWVQVRLAIHKRPSRTDQFHKIPSWRKSVWLITDMLLPGLYPEEYFHADKSARVDGKIVKVQREGSLTQKEVHHWPDSMREVTDVLHSV